MSDRQISRTGSAPQGQNLWSVVPLLVILATGASGQPAALWPAFLEPRDAFSADVVATIEHVWNESTFTRTVHSGVYVPFAVYAAFVDTPDVTAAAARFRKSARYEVTPLGNERYLADDGDGARGQYQVLRREPKRRVILSWGQHSGLLGTVKGSALSVLDLEPQGNAVDQTLTVYVRIENRVAAGLARLLIVLFGGIADRKLSEGFRVTAGVAEWAVDRPDEFCAWLTQEPLRQERRERILVVLRSCAAASPSQ